MLDTPTTPSLDLRVLARSLDDLTPQGVAAMRRLFDESPTAHTFQLPEYARFCSASDRAPIVLTARDGDVLLGYWLVHFEQYRRMGLPMFTAMARSGPVLRADVASDPRRALEAFAHAAIEAVFRRRTKKLVVTSETDYGALMSDVLPRLDFEREAIETFVIDLTAPLEEIEKRVNKAAMRGVRSAERAGLLVEAASTAGDADAYRTVLAEVLSQGGLEALPGPDFGERWLRLNQERPSPLLYGRDEDGSVAGGVLFFGAGALALNYHTAVRRNPPRLGDLLVWRQIVMAREMGFQRFDLLTVMPNPEPDTHEAGMRAFKAKWGGDLVSTPVFTYRPPRSVAYRATKALLGHL